ncbi:2-amino-4-hydroxy-6-hydroxymethyldihydropteridine diphosphokinase [Celeribacter sp.]|uniref:2-amino-4-hydroxy-6- hydroxymethyldihydropteridine diphosphokinase n=1 Tax=Celeribacter sp. TaxID=1890673 RepID=UPI003A8FF67A
MPDQDQRQFAYLALGGNLASPVGRPAQTLRAALAELGAVAGLSLRAVSPLYLTPCFPAGAGPDFVNACAVVETGQGAADLLALLHRIEARFGRVRQTRWAGRTLDIDLLALGATVYPDARTVSGWITMPADEQRNRTPRGLLLPHPRIQDRGFVLIPLRDVAPDWVHPLSGKTVAQMCDDLSESERAAIKPL